MLKKKHIPTALMDRTVPQQRPIQESRWPNMLFVWTLLKWAPRGLRMLVVRHSPRERGVVVRELFEHLGGLWIKVGQIFAMRRDLYTCEFCDELSALQDHVMGFPGDVARRIIEEDLGPLDGVFSEFDDVPLAAASIGQVHRGRLRDPSYARGPEVAIKVMRPDVARSFERDLSHIRVLAKLLQWLRPSQNWEPMATEVAQIMKEELDYRIEAHSVRTLRRTLKSHGIYVPKLFRRASSRRVLTMEFLSGTFMSDYIQVETTDPERLAVWRKRNHIDPKKVAKRLVMSFKRQVHEDNVFHADLHPGNIMLLRGSRIALIDMGSVGSMERSFAMRHNQLQRALAKREYERFCDLFLLLSPRLPITVDPEAVKVEVVRALRDWEKRAFIKDFTYHEKSVTTLMGELGQILQSHGVPVAWEFLKINRAQLTMDASLMYLYPEINYLKLAQRYERHAAKRRLKRLQPAKLVGGAISSLEGVLEMADGLGESMMLQLESIRKKAHTFESSMSKAALLGKEVFRVLALVFFLGTLGALAGLQHQHLGDPMGQTIEAVETRVEGALEDAGHPWDPGIEEVGDQALEKVPKIHWLGWFFILLVFATAIYEVLRLFKAFSTVDHSNHKRD